MEGGEGEKGLKRIASLPPSLRKSLPRLHDRKFLRIFYCVTIFMVIVIINSLRLFMPRTRNKGRGGGGGERVISLGIRKRRSVSSRKSERPMTRSRRVQRVPSVGILRGGDLLMSAVRNFANRWTPASLSFFFNFFYHFARIFAHVLFATIVLSRD